MSGLAIALVFMGVLRAVVVLQSAAQDDAYITYRYATNLAHSVGFVYNAGERVLGTTTPLFTILLGAGARFGVSPEAAAPWLAVVFDVLIGVVGWLALRTGVDRSLAWLWLLLYATFYLPLQACTHGMESQLFVLLVLATLVCFERRLVAPTGAFLGLAVLVRPEAVLLTPLLFLENRMGERRLRSRDLMRLAGIALVIVLPWAVFAQSYFGTVIPNSVTAKTFSANASFADWVGAFIGRNPMMAGLWLLFAVGAISLLRRNAAASRMWLAWTLIYLLFMLIARPPFYAAWYGPPVTPGFLLGVAAGALALAGIVLRSQRVRMAVVALAWSALAVVAWRPSMASMRTYKSVIDSVYIPMGGWIREHALPTDTVFAGDIGFIGWISQCRILDAAGLVSPNAWHYYRDHASDPVADVNLVLAERPRYVVLSTLSPTFARWTAPEFARVYEPVTRFRRTDPNAGRLGPNPDYTIFALRGQEQR